EFERSWVIPRSCLDLLQLGHGFHVNKRAKILWEVAVPAGFGAIWLERNKRIFEGSKECSDLLWDRVRYWVAIWLHDVKDFNNLPFSVVVRDWRPLL
ncbi:hypothetical protein TorRG33x02_284770, partial [Trema orientale]